MVPDKCCYILSGRPGEEPDSRILGWIPLRDVLGPAVGVWWPVTKWRRLK